MTSKRSIPSLFAFCSAIALTTAMAVLAPSAAHATVGLAHIQLPDRIPKQCLLSAADRYKVSPLAMLAILKVESNGRTGVVAKNRDGSRDYGPAQFNNRSWGKYMQEKYGISLQTITNNMCQALYAQGYALRSELNRCLKAGRQGNDALWCSVALYHHGGALPPVTPQAKKSNIHRIQSVYVKKVWSAYQAMVASGKF